MSNSRMLKSGFTILEVLISITLLSFIMIGVISITTDSMNTKDRIISEDRENLQIEMAMARLGWDFSQIYSPLYFSNKYQKPFVPKGQSTSETNEAEAAIKARFRGNQRFPFPNQEGLPVPKFSTPDKNTLIFYTSSNRRKRENTKESNFAWVKYSLESSQNNTTNGNEEVAKGDSLVRYFISKDPYNPERVNFDKVKGNVLMENIESIKFEFWDKKRRAWTDSLTTVDNGEYVIRGMRVTIMWFDANNIDRETIRIFRPLFPYFEPENLNKIAEQDYKKQLQTQSTQK